MWNVIGSFIIAKFVIRLFLVAIPIGAAIGLWHEYGPVPVIVIVVAIVGLAGWIKAQRKK